MRIGTACNCRNLDESLIRDFGIPQAVLMENAALAARGAACMLWNIPGRRVLAVCGGGNNGGDALALSRLLHAKGAEVCVLLTADPSSLSGAALDNFRIVKNLGLNIIKLDTSHSSQAVHALNSIDFSSYYLVVDGLFGTGLSRPVKGVPAHLIELINTSGRPVLALDIPSGINADTGEIMGCAVQAAATVSFGVPKRGNLLYPGFTAGGRLFVSEISFPPETVNSKELALSLNNPGPLPLRNPAGHKGSFGKILVVGGSPEYSGAPLLAAAAALKAGAGYVRLAVPEQLIDRMFPLLPEALFIPLECGGGAAGSEHVPDILKECARSDTLVLGPGLSTTAGSIRLARELIEAAECPLIIDGDALTALAGKEELCREKESPVILTPHPAEMARLLGSSVHEVNTRRVDCALEAAGRYNAVTVLKGAHSIIAFPSGEAKINLTGNSGMATAGSGDVLAGITGALAAGCPAETAAALGVFIHGMAGDLAAAACGEHGTTAQNILNSVPEAFRLYPEEIRTNPYSGKITLL